jgi:hypothetical protein
VVFVVRTSGGKTVFAVSQHRPRSGRRAPVGARRPLREAPTGVRRDGFGRVVAPPVKGVRGYNPRENFKMLRFQIWILSLKM